MFHSIVVLIPPLYKHDASMVRWAPSAVQCSGDYSDSYVVEVS